MFLCLLMFIQLITESLPISSSGHVTLAEHFLSPDKTSFLSQSMSYFLHGPTSIILMLFFRKRWFFILRHPWRCRFIILRLLLYGFCAEIATLFWFFLLQKFSLSVPLSLGFFITACLLLSLRYAPKHSSSLTAIKATVIGFVQGMALLPGISRLGSTYSIGRHLGLSPQLSFVFSCTIEWPLITVGFFKGAWELAAQGAFPHSMLACLVVASVLSYVALSVTYTMALRSTLWHWGIYMIVPTMAALLI